MSFQDETKTRRILGHWQGASEAHTRSGLQRASNAASGTKDQRISLSLKAIWNKFITGERSGTRGITSLPFSLALIGS